MVKFYYSNSEKNFPKRIINITPLFVTSKCTSAIDHVNKNFVFNSVFKAGVNKTNLLYQFVKKVLKIQNIKNKPIICKKY